VLDPFCGTDGLLIASAAFGARVVGSDVDADCLGLLPAATDPGYIADTEDDVASKKKVVRSKNSNFKRLGLAPDLHDSQLNLNVSSNFGHYGLEDSLVSLLGMDAADWAQPMGCQQMATGRRWHDGLPSQLTQIDLDSFGQVSKHPVKTSMAISIRCSSTSYLHTHALPPLLYSSTRSVRGERVLR